MENNEVLKNTEIVSDDDLTEDEVTVDEDDLTEDNELTEPVELTDKQRIKEYTRRLGNLQQRLKAVKLPVIVVFEGWGASGKGYIVGKLINRLDPRNFKVYAISAATADEKRYPIMKRFWAKLPEYGKAAFFVRSWYREVSLSRVEDEISIEELDLRFREILDFESQLSDDGYLIIKIFLHLSKDEQRKRFKKLESNKSTKWRVTKDDWKHHADYDKYQHAFSEMFERTNRESAPWFLIDAEDRTHATAAALECITNCVESTLEKREAGIGVPTQALEIRTSESIRLLPQKQLFEIDPNGGPFDEENYKADLKRCQKRLFELHNILYKKRVPCVIAYEGWDAAGKGSNIKRLTDGLDPRGYEVIPIAAPTAPEINRQYLWRFWTSLPRDGHIAIYDRSWYGRVMVERIEGFCTEAQWKRAFDEINRFERSLAARGTIVIKFWLQIDPDEQLRRFERRQNTPEKQWKITAEDWRNREKWAQYEVSVNDMLRYTTTEIAPWVIVESNNKKYAHLKAIKEVIRRLEEEL